MKIALEDTAGDILGKAQRGLRLSDAELAARAGVSESHLGMLKTEGFDLPAIRPVAGALALNAEALLAAANGTYQPADISLRGLASFSTSFEDLLVNSYLVWDEDTKEAAAFDTGTDAAQMLEFLAVKGLTLGKIFLTHTHADHILAMGRLMEKTGAVAWVGDREPVIEGAVAFSAGKTFSIGNFPVETRLTWGHAQGGITYVVQGLDKPLAIVGDAVFAGSMGGGVVSYAEALRTNREEIMTLPDATILACGHGPLTTVGEQKTFNPFLAQTSRTSQHLFFMKKSLAFVGVGRMGGNMARRLSSQGFPVVAVLDSHRQSAEELASEIGARAVTTLAGVTASADVILTVVTDDATQLALYGETGDSLLVGAREKTFLNCATVSPATHCEIERRVENAGAHSLEVCMASSIPQALSGSLYLMCAGKREVFDSVQDVLIPLSEGGRLLRFIGKAGQAAQVKALVNMVMNINTAGLAEGLGLAAALGLDLKTVLEVFSQTGANSRVLATDGEDMLQREHSCFFSAAHAAKDSGIALSLAAEQGLNLPLAVATKAQYDRLVAAGLGDLDKSGVAELTFPGRTRL